MIGPALLAMATLCWGPSEPFQCFDPPYTRAAPEGYRVYLNTSGSVCEGPSAWSMVAAVPAVPGAPRVCATYDEPLPSPGVCHFVIVKSWNSSGESSRFDPPCLDPPKVGINPEPCP
jgi:hypothetical protein